jgi:hypothetical protein
MRLTSGPFLRSRHRTLCLIHPEPGLQFPVAFKEFPNELQQPLVLHPFGDLTHQFVAIDPNRKTPSECLHSSAPHYFPAGQRRFQGQAGLSVFTRAVQFL